MTTEISVMYGSEKVKSKFGLFLKGDFYVQSVS